MNTDELRAAVQALCPAILYMETDSPEALEGECRMWGQDGCTILIDLPQPFSGSLNGVAEAVNRHLAYLEHNREAVLAAIAAASVSGSLKPESAAILYTAFWLDKDGHVFCDFALNAENRCHELTLSPDAEGGIEPTYLGEAD